MITLHRPCLTPYPAIVSRAFHIDRTAERINFTPLAGFTIKSLGRINESEVLAIYKDGDCWATVAVVRDVEGEANRMIYVGPAQ